MKTLNWGILGTGYIAEKFANDFKFVFNGKLTAVASRSVEKAKKFATKYNIEKYYGSYEDLLNDKEIDVVYIATPHTTHAELSIKAARKKKHILCEKPMSVNYPQAMAVINEVKKNKVFFMEAFMYRTHPQTEKIISLLKEKVIGEIKIICSEFSFKSNFNEENRLWNHKLAGGAILDVGTYCVSMSRLIAGVAVNKNFEEPVEIKGLGKLAKTNVDELAVGIMVFPSGILAQMSTGICVQQENSLKIYGTEGEIYVPLPWFPGLDATESKIFVIKENKKEEIVVKPQKPLYAIEAEKVNEWILNGKTEAEYPAMTYQDSLNNMKVLDKWRESFGFNYEFEKNNVYISTI